MLGDENNNELFDLANFDAKKTALLAVSYTHLTLPTT